MQRQILFVFFFAIFFWRGCTYTPLHDPNNSATQGHRELASNLGFAYWEAPETLTCREQQPQDFLIRRNMFKRDKHQRILQTHEAQVYFVKKLEKSILWRTRMYGEANDSMAANYANQLRKEEKLNIPQIKTQIVASTFMGIPIYVHKKIMNAVKCVEQEIQNNCQKEEVMCDAYDDNGYCKKTHSEVYVAKALSTLRDKNSYVGGEISNHMFGLAIDIDPNRNPCCGCVADWAKNARCSWKVTEVMRSDLPDCWIDSFKKYGFYWLGEDDMGDTMHFEFLGDPDKI